MHIVDDWGTREHIYSSEKKKKKSISRDKSVFICMKNCSVWWFIPLGSLLTIGVQFAMSDNQSVCQLVYFPKAWKKTRKETDTTHSLTRVWRSQIDLYVYDEERLCIDVHLIPYVHNKQWVSSVKGMFSAIHCIFITHLTAGSVVLYLHCNLDAFYCSFIKMLTIAKSYLRTDTGRSWEYETYLPASSKQTESHYFCCIASFHQYMTKAWMECSLCCVLWCVCV